MLDAARPRAHVGLVVGAGLDDPATSPRGVLEAFRTHLAAERSLSPHTVRAYLGDVSSFLEYAAEQGIHHPAAVDVRVLRGWLARQSSAFVELAVSLAPVYRAAHAADDPLSRVAFEV